MKPSTIRINAVRGTREQNDPAARSAVASMLYEALENIGAAPHAAKALMTAAARRAGMLVICGPAGVGKTTLAEVLAQDAGATILGDLRMPDEIAAALSKAELTSVVAVVRSGESLGLFSRWRDMGIALPGVERASVTTVTLRRLPRLGLHDAGVAALLVVEVLGPDGALLTGSLVDEATALVAAGLTTAEAARFNVPGFQ